MKNILQSKTIWGAIVSLIVSIFAIFDIKIAADELQQVAEAIGLIIGFALTVYGRMKAKKELTVSVPPAASVIAFLLITSLVMPGCATIRANPEATKAILKTTLRIGLQAGLQAITHNNPELKPYLLLLSQSFVFSAEGDKSPETLIKSVTILVEQKVPDKHYQTLILSSVVDSIAIYEAFYKKNPEAKFDQDKKDILLTIAHAIDSVATDSVGDDSYESLRLN
jgi:hypothetical protein